MSPTAPPPRILMVGNFLSNHVATRGVGEELAEHLKEAGWKVARTSDHRSRLPRLMAMQATIWRRRRDFDAAQVDVFSGNAFLWAEAAGWSLKRLGKPFVLTLHGGLLPEFAKRWPRRVRRLLAAAATVTTPSPYLQGAMAPYREGMVLVPNPLTAASYPYRLRRTARPRLVWLRAFHATYNPELAPRVLAALPPRHDSARLTMIGPDKGDGSLGRTKRRIAELGLNQRITIVPGIPKEEVPAALAQGDIFLNTTNADNTPVSVLEALACGLCVASTNVGGLPHLLRHGEEALLAPPENAEALASAVSRILDEPELARRLSAAGRAKAEAVDWSHVLPRWQELLRRAAGTRL